MVARREGAGGMGEKGTRDYEAQISSYTNSPGEGKHSVGKEDGQ